MTNLFLAIDNSLDTVSSYLSKLFDVSEERIIEYCNKIGYKDYKLNIVKAYEGDLIYDYSKLCNFIDESIKSEDEIKVDKIISKYHLSVGFERVTTPQISELETKYSYTIFRDSLRRVLTRIRNKQELTPDDYYDLDAIFNIYFYKIPEEDRESIIKSIPEDYKKYYLEKNYNSIFKKKQDGIFYFYTPKLNGVPVHSLDFNEDDMETIIKKGNTSILNTAEKYYGMLLFYIDNPYLHSFLVPDYLKKSLSIYNKINNNDVLEELSKHFDKNNILDFKNKREKNKEQYEDDKKYHLSNDFINKIISKIPEDYNDLEKVLYVYYTLCYILTYDNHYYVDNKTINNTLRSSMFNIDEMNNEVVCYQFASSLKDILNSLEIETSNLKYNYNQDKFMNSHQKLTIHVDNMILDADSTRLGADNDDLTFVKIGKIGNGIRCNMYNKDSQQKFLQAKKKVSERIIDDYNINYYKDIEEDLRAFNNVYSRDIIKDTSKKFSLIFYELDKFQLSRVDSLALYNQLFKYLFTDDEKNYIRNSYTQTEDEWSVKIRSDDMLNNNTLYYNFDTKTIAVNNQKQL
ncbi:MAG: hypothetical protein IJI58_02260 [Bacilli bacterium]|nr:hypothetical protein [Bacilli bacterium]